MNQSTMLPIQWMILSSVFAISCTNQTEGSSASDSTSSPPNADQPNATTGDVPNDAHGAQPGAAPVEDAPATEGEREAAKGEEVPVEKSDGGSQPPAPPAGGYRLSPSLDVTEVAVFQAVKVSLERDGKKTARTSPVVAGRDALVRVYVTPRAGKDPRPVTAILNLVAADGTVLSGQSTTQTLTAASTDASAASTFNFSVPGTSLPPGVKYSVALTEPEAEQVPDGVAHTARYPADGSAESADAAPSGPVKIVFVPVVNKSYSPDTSEAQLERYRATMNALFPVTGVEIQMHAPMPWDGQISRTGAGISELLNAVTALRADDDAADDVYYWGSFAPAASFSQYCQSSCVSGLSGVVTDPSYASFRASVGIGFPGETSALTMAHEIGHAHGRVHSPCGGVAQPDPAYPHEGGAVGVWGYDNRNRNLIAPSSAFDIMGYCQPEWISDFTYTALHQRVAAINGAQAMWRGTPATPTQYDMVVANPDGHVSWGKSARFTREPSGEPHTVSFRRNGQRVATGTAYVSRFDHLPGVSLVLPQVDAQYTEIAIDGVGTFAARK